MKKLVIILFVGIYSVTAFGAGVLSYDCCEKPAAVVAAISLAGNNDNNCDNTHSNDLFQNHHVAAPAHHFTSRKFYSTQYAYLPAFSIAANVHHPCVIRINNNAAAPSLTIPVYILHCVYRI